MSTPSDPSAPPLSPAQTREETADSGAALPAFPETPAAGEADDRNGDKALDVFLNGEAAGAFREEDAFRPSGEAEDPAGNPDGREEAAPAALPRTPETDEAPDVFRDGEGAGAFRDEQAFREEDALPLSGTTDTAGSPGENVSGAGSPEGEAPAGADVPPGKRPSRPGKPAGPPRTAVSGKKGPGFFHTHPLLTAESAIPPSLGSRLFGLLALSPLLVLTLLLAAQVLPVLETRPLWYSDEIRHAAVFQ